MKFITQAQRQVAIKELRTIYIDLIDNWPEVYKRLFERKAFITDAILTNKYQIPAENLTVQVTRARPGNFEARFADMCGNNPLYKISQFEANKDGNESVRAARGMVLTLDHVGIKLAGLNEILVEDFGNIVFSDNGVITACDVRPQAIGHDVLQFLGCFIEQDFGVLMCRGTDLYYTFICANFEKTPKNVDTGVDSFVGQNFLEWHRRIPNAMVLHDFLFSVHQAFGKGLFDCLMVDLRGRHLYTDGEAVVQRYERDFVMPLRDLNGEYVGQVHYADSVFKDVKEERRPHAGGSFLDIPDAFEFYREFEVIKHKAYQDHPTGPRQEPVAV